MYPITSPRVGQRVSLAINRYVNADLAVVTEIVDQQTVRVLVDGATETQQVAVGEITAVTPGNEDGYFDWPPGYGFIS